MKYSAEQLLDSVCEMTEIVCDKCGHKDEMPCDSFDAVNNWFEEGWRQTLHKCYCPECAKKYLKIAKK